MRISRRQGERGNADPSLLRTCQVCSHAKLRCERTQDSGLCDRCLRLKKTCIFPPARRGQAPAQRTNRISQLEAEIARLDNILASQQGGSVGSHPSPGSARGASRSSSTYTKAGEGAEESIEAQTLTLPSLNPFELGLLTTETGELLLDRFRTSLTPYFPFVIIPESVKVTDLHREKPILCLAILFASSHDHGVLQARLSRLFERMLATALLQGQIATLENLQGLVIHTAWMQFQPRPRKHTQNIFLAMSILYDLDLHKPRDLPTRRNEDDNLGLSTAGLRPEEVRALVGLYIVASSASVILDKFHCFPTMPFLAESCAALAQQAEHPTDRYLPQIVGLLHMIEDVYDLAKNTTARQSDETSTARVTNLHHQWRSLKESLPPHAASFPFLNIQTHTAELLLGEIALPGSSVACSPDPAASLVETISAVKSLMELLLSAEPGHDICFTNPAWVTFGYGLSLGVKLDILCTTCDISPSTTIELRQSLDMSGMLKRLIERMNMSIAQSKNMEVEVPHPLDQFLSRAEKVERWYARHGPPTVHNSSQQNPETFTSPELMNDRQDSLPGHLHPDVEDDVLLGPMDSQDLGSTFDIDMFAFEGLEFEGMNFMMDPQEGWNPFVFSDGDCQMGY